MLPTIGPSTITPPKIGRFEVCFDTAGRAVIALAVTLAVWSSAANVAKAQEYPSHPVKIIVPFPAGGTADVMPRLFTDWLARKWGQPVIIENRSGAGGNIGAEAVAKAEPDGYTLLAAPPPPLVINQNLYPKLGFDPLEFSPVAIMGRVPNGLEVNPKLSVQSVADMIAQGRTNPGKLTCATQGNGTTSHLTSEMFQMMANVRFQQVPYRGSAPALADLVAGNVDLMFDNLGAALALVKGGQLRLIAVAAPTRVASLPDVPAIAETLPGFESVTWFAVVAPPRTPEAVLDKLNADFNEALHQPDILHGLAQLSAEPVGGTRQATAAYMRTEAERWNKVIKAANIRLE
ncbi:MAG TPA: tripartite tricarboxylate transporter substrate binding protein [Xanthobacteraceae bacterium]